MSVRNKSYVYRSMREEPISYAHNLTVPVTNCMKKQRSLQKADNSACQHNKFNIPSNITNQVGNSYIMCTSVEAGLIKVVANFDDDSQADFAIELKPEYKNKKFNFIETTSIDKNNSLLSCP